MTRPDPARKQALLDRICDYVLANGIADLSLRPLAAALGTSGRMLIYYFGSKDALVVDVLAAVRHRKYRDLALVENDADVLRSYWSWAMSREGRTYLRLVYEIYGLSLRDPERFGGFLAAETIEVVGFISEGYREAGVAAEHAEALAAYTFAGLRGLELDALATDDPPRVQLAFDMFEQDLERRLISLIDAAGAPGRRTS